MSFALKCPNCGERPVAEYRFGGEDRPRPAGETVTFAALYQRRNIQGLQEEWWFHRFGCRRWFLARRDTRDNQVLATWWPAESRNSAAESSPEPAPLDLNRPEQDNPHQDEPVIA